MTGITTETFGVEVHPRFIDSSLAIFGSISASTGGRSSRVVSESLIVLPRITLATSDTPSRSALKKTFIGAEEISLRFLKNELTSLTRAHLLLEPTGRKKSMALRYFRKTLFLVSGFINNAIGAIAISSLSYLVEMILSVCPFFNFSIAS